MGRPIQETKVLPEIQNGATHEIGAMVDTLVATGTELIDTIHRDAEKIKKEIGEMISNMTVSPGDASFIGDAYSNLSKHLSEADDAYADMGKFKSFPIEDVPYAQPGRLEQCAKRIEKMANAYGAIFECRRTVEKIKSSYDA